MERIRLREFLKRVRVALSLIVGFVAGKLTAEAIGHHAPEFFIGAFMLGVIATQLLYAAVDRLGGGE